MGHNERVLGCVLVVLVAGIVRSWEFVERLARNPFTPAIPRAVEPRYPLVEDAVLASDITVVVGTKDTITPTVTQLRHLADALPQGVRVLYTFPQPLWEDADEYAAKLKEAAGLLGERVRLVPVGSFCNPFEAWLQAVPLVRTKYTLLMHNDVFLLDTRGHFLSELYGALEAHPEHTVAAPQIYETELRGLLTTHLFNTNLHLRLNAAGVAFMSHEVDLAMGLSREPADFAEKVNPNFLEDHVFLVRTAAVDGRLIDPQAAFTLEYVDLQLNMLRQNLTQLYVPSARAEFRLWEVGWQDVPYFVRRRSEEQARQTKQHLERKWGVEFPNTGFCNFVKFSIIRHVRLSWAELPSRWLEQAALFAAWFEMVGFNRHNERPLGELLAVLPAARADVHYGGTSAAANVTAAATAAAAAAAAASAAAASLPPPPPPLNLSLGLSLTSRRELVSTSKVDPSDWVRSGIGELLRFQPNPIRLETRYQVEHMSLAVLRVPLGPPGASSPFAREAVLPLCGMLVRERATDVCWIYVAPHAFDHPLFQVRAQAQHEHAHEPSPSPSPSP
jgi:hypothetical protein